MPANNTNEGIITKAMTFFRESRAELRKVAWPTKKQVGYSTAAVVILTVLVGLYIGVVDAALTGLISLMLG